MVEKGTEGYDFFPTTADLGISVYSRDLAGLFKQAGRALFSVMTDIDKIESTNFYDIVLEAPTIEELLVVWLNELLYLSEIHQSFFCTFDLNHVNDTELKGRISGERIEVRRHSLYGEVKAATYHQLKVEHRDDGYLARFILDM